MFKLFKKSEKINFTLAEGVYPINHPELPEELREIGASFSPPAEFVDLIYSEFWLYSADGELLEVIWFEE